MPFGGLLSIGLIGAGSSIFGGLFGASAQKSAAKIQADAATKQADAIRYSADQTRAQYERTRSDLMPYMTAGTESLQSLVGKLKDGSLGAAYGQTFKAPTADEARQTPGYQFTQGEGEKGIQRAASAAGGAFTGGTLKDLMKYDTGLADATYNDTFLRSLQQYNTNYNTWSNDQTRGYNFLSGVANLGETASAQSGSLGATNQGQVNNLTLAATNADTSAAAALAAGKVGAANSIVSGINGAVNNVSSYMGYRALGDRMYTAPLVDPNQGLSPYANPNQGLSPYSRM